MADIITEARDLVQAARDSDRCLREARNVERKLEDLKDSTSAGNWQIISGVAASAGGIVIGLVTGWTGVGAAAGVGLAAGGLAAVAGGLGAKRDAMEKAMKELRRAIEDLQECLG